MTGDRTGGSTWREWRPLLGERYTTMLMKVRRRQYLCFIIGIVLTLLMVGFIFLLKNSPLLWAGVGLFLLAAVASFIVGSLPLLRLGKRMASDLQASGHVLTHLPSIQNSYTFSRWLEANHLDAAALDAAAGAEH